ncbi:hypothetical protein EW026_g2560 [Hermanssonia centrifuga]|uniref:Uncharacterized protein n=1 Tax=Hermanssonia centrifuga TaxID=98765 RepID=A0A4V3XAY3_9APHY|nr:hypothetical protein EW026_g2560 [Hermanssonia centrifuga]
MVTTRGQEAAGKATTKTGPKKGQVKKKEEPETNAKRDIEEVADHIEGAEGEPEVKKARVGNKSSRENEDAKPETKGHPAEHSYQAGTIERGHIYFFYRPRVQLEEVHSMDDVQRFHILLVPRPPKFSVGSDQKDAQPNEDEEMKLISSGSDVIPAPESTNEKKKPFRLLAIGKKQLPDPEASGGGRKGVFWALVSTVGEDLQKLQDGLGEKEYETKTRGTRHQGPARLAARGAYAIVNNEAKTPSQRETHLGYHLSHPIPENFGDVQEALGIHPASSFVLQVKNPLAPNTGSARVGLPSNRRAEFPAYIMKEVFGQGGARGREDFGLKFASVERKEMLDHEGAELLLIAARSGEEGLDKSLQGEGRGQALKGTEETEGHKSIETVLKELAMDSQKIPAEPLEGNWE